MSPVELFYLAFAGVTAAVIAIALVFGRTPERLSATIFAVATIISQISSRLIPHHQLGSALLLIDGIMSFGFLYLALRYGYLWLALLMLATAGYFSVHSFYLAMAMPPDRIFVISSNFATGIALLSIAIGVWTSRHRRDEGH
ncbi:MAG: hypothetical protein IM658_04525 [Phenylobacterium sp.]|jgi:hypothetical protein|uniref:hypothetical protein n=1 Tax=Phenylobacterium sp. TaxID=1871053 RepID=UPI0025FE9338|nr:hypothetical protein [Phenylobacterium sp.]MCA3711827.1 hypothetical protein [Phenylobacterium sp.]MCA3723591.1 hypothetical protein [Phenylobacterium sp.]MCA3725486.1 hypothetical protein [Phenylobacterium sp.]MCA6238367.1 hypothetical protein [Phenylobacterium sp.]MCA6240521.1 hypothetical protein [Phenylobacterium sp.]